MLLNFDATRSVLLVQRLNCLFDAPFVLQNVEADRSVLIDIRVKDRRSEDNGRRAVRVVRREGDRKLVRFSRVHRLVRSCCKARCFPVFAFVITVR